MLRLIPVLFTVLFLSFTAQAQQQGLLDPTFNPTYVPGGNGGPNGEVLATLLQPDGKIIIAGDFTAVDGVTANRIARLNADGTLDATFITGTGANNKIYAMALQPDGKIIIGGYFTQYNGTARRLARLNTNGTLDLTFNPGTGPTNGEVNAIALQPDGKIIVAGNFSHYNGTPRGAIARITSTGTLDPTFTTSVNFSLGGNVFTLIVQPDNKIVLAGEFWSVNGNTAASHLARVHADGTLDAAFLANMGTGVNYGDIFTSNLQPDGKIILGGNFGVYNSIPRNGVVRINADGSIDLGFNTVLAVNGIGGATFMASVVQPDGKIVLGGYDYDFGASVYGNADRNGLFRLHPDGSIDNTFLGFGTFGDITGLVLQPDGKIIIGGNIQEYNGQPTGAIARINADGLIDEAFSLNVIAQKEALKTLVQTDGKILLAGENLTYYGTTNRRLIRFNSDGTLDAGFDVGLGPDFTVLDMQQLPDGRLVIVGDFTRYNNIPRIRMAVLNADGSLDTSFDPGIGANKRIWSVSVQADGKYIIAGNFTTIGGVARNKIARLNTDGSLDVSFTPNLEGLIAEIIALPGGQTVVAGSFATFNGSDKALYWLNPDGSRDYTKTTLFPLSGSAPQDVGDISLYPDGKILASGSFNNSVLRVLPNGQIDYSLNLSNILGNVQTSTLLPDGKIIITGDIYAHQSPAGVYTTLNGIARFNANGTLDTTFFHTGTGPASILPAPYNIHVKDVAVQPNGAIILAGIFDTFHGQGRSRIARLTGHPDGSIFTGTTSSSNLCPGQTVQVPFVSSTTFTPGNQFSAQLSDRFGSFANPVTIGTLTDTTSATINATMPTEIVAGANYKIRVVSTSPALIGTENSTSITVNAISLITFTDSICIGGFAWLTGNNSSFYSWLPGPGLDPSGSSANVIPTAPGVYTYSLAGANNGCPDTASVTITVFPLIQQISVSAAPDSLAPGDLLTLTINNPTPGATYSWSGPGLNQTTGSTVTANPTLTGVALYEITGTLGSCPQGTSDIYVQVNPNFLGQTTGWDWANSGGSINGILQAGTTIANNSAELLITGGETGIDITTDAAGNTTTLGRFKGSATFGTTTLVASGDEDMVILRTNTAGTILWAKRAGSSDYENPAAITTDDSGNTLITGSYADTAFFDASSLLSTAGTEAAFLVSYNAAGAVNWVAQGAGQETTIANDVAIGLAGSSTITGSFTGTTIFGNTSITSTGNHDIFVARYDNQGNVIWVKNFGSAGDDSGYSLTTDNQGNTYVTGTFQGAVNFGNFTLTSISTHSKFITKLDGNGTVVWAKITGIADALNDAEKISTDNNQLYTAGNFSGTTTIANSSTIFSKGSTDLYLAAYHLNGNLIWVKRAGGTGADAVTGLTTDAAGFCYLTGSYTAGFRFGNHLLSDLGGEDVFVAKYDLNGNALWARKAGGINNDAGMAIAADAQGNSYITGYFSGRATFGNQELFSNGAQDMFVAKLSHIAAVGIADSYTPAGSLAVYPNPFTSGFSIEFNSVTTKAEIVVSDVLGRQVFNNIYPTQTGEVTLQIQPEKQLPQGLYLLQIKQNDQTHTVRIIKQ